MEELTHIQKVTAFFIVIPAVAISIGAIFLKESISSFLTIYGLILISVGLSFAALFGQSIIDLIYFIDTHGVGRAYVIGCMLLLSGVITKILGTVVFFIKQYFFRSE